MDADLSISVSVFTAFTILIGLVVMYCRSKTCDPCPDCPPCPPERDCPPPQPCPPPRPCPESTVECPTCPPLPAVPAPARGQCRPQVEVDDGVRFDFTRVRFVPLDEETIRTQLTVEKLRAPTLQWSTSSSALRDEVEYLNLCIRMLGSSMELGASDARQDQAWLRLEQFITQYYELMRVSDDSGGGYQLQPWDVEGNELKSKFRTVFTLDVPMLMFRYLRLTHAPIVQYQRQAIRSVAISVIRITTPNPIVHSISIYHSTFFVTPISALPWAAVKVLDNRVVDILQNKAYAHIESWFSNYFLIDGSHVSDDQIRTLRQVAEVMRRAPEIFDFDYKLAPFLPRIQQCLRMVMHEKVRVTAIGVTATEPDRLGCKVPSLTLEEGIRVVPNLKLLRVFTNNAAFAVQGFVDHRSPFYNSFIAADQIAYWAHLRQVTTAQTRITPGDKLTGFVLPATSTSGKFQVKWNYRYTYARHECMSCVFATKNSGFAYIWSMPYSIADVMLSEKILVSKAQVRITVDMANYADSDVEYVMNSPEAVKVTLSKNEFKRWEYVQQLDTPTPTIIMTQMPASQPFVARPKAVRVPEYLTFKYVFDDYEVNYDRITGDFVLLDYHEPTVRNEPITPVAICAYGLMTEPVYYRYGKCYTFRPEYNQWVKEGYEFRR